MVLFNIQEELKKLPDKPGVYLMKDKSDNIIYIGKAIVLKNRVRQYFQNSRNHTTKISKMVSLVKEFEYIVTDSELEALILECNLIKKHRPQYNTLLKDDKTYPYIKITVNEAFPRVFITRKFKKDKGKYYGPYTNVVAVREVLEIIKNMWPTRTCNLALPKDIGKHRPCLNYHIGKCSAPCVGEISQQDYRILINEIENFLSGKYDDVIEKLKEKMNEYSTQLNFEKAAEYRDKINSINRISEKQKMSNANTNDEDIIAYAKQDDEILVQIFFVRSGNLIGREHYMLKNTENMSNEEIIEVFIKQFYSGTPFIPNNIIIQNQIKDIELLQTWLTSKKGQKVTIKVPQKGAKIRLVELARKNAEITLSQFGDKLKREHQKTIGALKELYNMLNLKREINRIEAYDISNTQGFQSVGSMVVFESGKPKRNDYRKFKIKTIIGANDYGSMEEVLNRRFKHAIEETKYIQENNIDVEAGKFTNLPDLILMDGGKGQVNIAEKVLQEMGLQIDVCGMVKDEKHRTRGLYYKNVEINIKSNTEAFKMITRIQDEAHRFAIEYHKKLRWDNQIKSVLDDIQGIGATRRKELMKHFGSINKIKEAKFEEILNVNSMNNTSAKSVYDFFHNQ